MPVMYSKYHWDYRLRSASTFTSTPTYKSSSHLLYILYLNLPKQLSCTNMEQDSIKERYVLQNISHCKFCFLYFIIEKK